MAKTVLKTLTDYFNAGDGKRALSDWAKEIRALSDEEKRELAEGVAAVTGEPLSA